MTRLTLVTCLTLSTLAAAQTNGEAPSVYYPCPLQGLQDGRLTLTEEGALALFDGKTRLATANLPDLGFNSAKGNVECEKTRISISSQMPFRATRRSQTLTWKSGALQVGETVISDPSEEAMKRFDKLLKEGHIELALEQLSEMSYGHTYYNESEIAGRVLQRAHELALTRYKARDAAGAARVMGEAFSYLAHCTQCTQTAPLPADQLTALRNDYGFFLDEAGRHAEAEKELRQVVTVAPERAVARLNLGDALWAQGKKGEAEAQYRAYAQRIPRKKWPATLRERCPGCALSP